MKIYEDSDDVDCNLAEMSISSEDVWPAPDWAGSDEKHKCQSGREGGIQMPGEAWDIDI